MDSKTKKYIIIILVVFILLGAGAIGAYAISQLAIDPKEATISSIEQITSEEAKAIAYKDAGVTDKEVKAVKIDSDVEDGIPVYEMEFSTADTKYKYEIKVTDGSIYNKSTKKKGADKTTYRIPEDITTTTFVLETTTAAQETTVSGKYIGIDEAKQIALDHAGLEFSEKITFTKAKLERDDGRMLYEIEFVIGSMEYEYEINATNGKIYSSDIDYIDFDEN